MMHGPIKPKPFQLDDLTKLPAALKPLTKEKRWVVWKWVWKGNKWTKPPFQPADPSRFAQNNNPQTWGTFKEAVARVKSGEADGIGFCLLDFNLGAEDLDDCRELETGLIDLWAQGHIDQSPPDAYAEVTVSGTGLRIIGTTKGKELHCNFTVDDGPGKYELYRSCARYITISGRALPGRGERPLGALDAYLQQKEQEGNAGKAKAKPGPGRPKGSKNKAQLPNNLQALLLLPDNGAGNLVANGLYADRSGAIFGFLKLALAAGFDEETLIEHLSDERFKGGAIYQHCLDNGGEKYIRGQIAHAEEDMESADGRKIVRLEVGKVTETVRAIELAIKNSPKCQVYRRGKNLVEPLWSIAVNSHTGIKELETWLRPLDATQFGHLLQKHAIQFQRRDSKGKFAPIDWSYARTALETLLGLQHADLRRVKGIISSPTMRPDGSLLTAAGYDEATQLWHRQSPDITLSEVPDRPTRKEAEEALALFEELLPEFPFKEERDKSVVLAGFLTVALRAAFPNAPLFMVTAPEPRSGKTFICLLISAMASGWAPKPTAGSRNSEEMEKRIETALLGGPQILYLNNLPDGMTLSSSALEQIATEAILNIRKLGKMEEGSCDCRGATTVLINGNNIVMSGALVERTLVSRIDAKMENPGERTFKNNPLQIITANRGKYLAAAFTLVRAYIAAGSPRSGATPFAGFEKWSHFVREPLLWLGVADPFGTVVNARSLDPRRNDLRTLITELRRYIKLDEPFESATLIPLAEEKFLTGARMYELVRPQLNAVLRDLKGKLDANTIGRFKLMANRDKSIDGFRIELVTKDEKSANSFKLVWVGEGEPPKLPQETEEKPF
jgi:putative DNA primase/helicase